MKNWIKNNAWCIYLGAIPSIADVNIMNWRWWVICIPTVLLVSIYKDNNKTTKNILVCF